MFFRLTLVAERNAKTCCNFTSSFSQAVGGVFSTSLLKLESVSQFLKTCQKITENGQDLRFFFSHINREVFKAYHYPPVTYEEGYPLHLHTKDRCY